MPGLLQKILLSAALLGLVIEGAPHVGPHGSIKGQIRHEKGGKHGQGGKPGAGNSVAAKGIYFLTNDAQNAVIALPIAADGTLSDGTVTATGGAGSNSIDGSTNLAAAPDALVSQSSLTIAGQVSQASDAYVAHIVGFTNTCLESLRC
jgi:hypothetical protein